MGYVSNLPSDFGLDCLHIIVNSVEFIPSSEQVFIKITAFSTLAAKNAGKAPIFSKSYAFPINNASLLANLKTFWENKLKSHADFPTLVEE